MHAVSARWRSIVGTTSLTAGLAVVTLGFASAPASAQTVPAAPSTCPVLSLGNPNPGDNVLAGGYVVSGTAYDPLRSQAPPV